MASGKRKSGSSAKSAAKASAPSVAALTEFARTSTATTEPTFAATSEQFGLDPREFGPLENEKYLYKQQLVAPVKDRTEELIPYLVMIETHLQYLIMIIVGHIRDFLDTMLSADFRNALKEQNGYAPILTDFDSFYTRRLKQRLSDLFSRPTTGVPGREINVFRRKFKPHTFFELETEIHPDQLVSCVNLSSYNYLGFAQSVGTCATMAEEAVNAYGTVAGGARFGTGSTRMITETEQLVADFVGKESAMIFSMGYGTNAMLFSNLVDKRCLVLSDQLNHASMRTGIRISGAVIKVFKHNDMDRLEQLIREQIAQGQPRSRRPWHKILIVFEGLYSMEGTMCNLPRLLELKRKYGVYLFMDEAHSIGAMGPNGRGICDYFGVSPSEVDILMGTFTKSFGSVGGYVAGTRELVDRLRVANMSSVYGEAPAPATLAQIQGALRTIRGELNPGEGELRLQRLAFNSRYFRVALRRMGFIVPGHIDSPVIPVLLCHPTKLALSSRWMFAHKIAIVIVGYPATDLATARIRFCMSAALTKSDLDYVLEKMEELGDEIHFKMALGLDGQPAPRERFADFRHTLAAEVLDPTLT